MKKIFLFILVLAIAGSSIAQRTAPKPAAPNAQEDSIQYALGVYMMQQLLAKTGFVVTNPTLFKKAIDDVAGKKKLMIDPATTEARLLAYQNAYQLEKGRRLEQLLFDQAKKQPNYNTLSTGVMYSVVRQGQGPVPALLDTVILNVNSTLADGTVINDAAKSKQSFMTITSDMIPGLRDVVQRMREGSICKAIIPASQAYGSQGNGNIPPNSALIYEIALVSVRPAK
jgi:FKBP-type peptidyl-prolyl cis-trans isomerase FklB